CARRGYYGYFDYW
nr:immunoglobulin heavy chain junction region [Mus musculus]